MVMASNAERQRGIARAAAVHFLLFFAMGCVLPFTAVFFTARGMDTFQVGLLQALPPALSVFVSSASGVWADRYHSHRRVFAISSALSAMAIAAFPLLPATFLANALLQTLLSVVRAPSVCMADAVVLLLLRTSAGCSARDYGKSRLWGAVGWGLGAVVASTAEEFASPHISFASSYYGILSFSLSALAFGVLTVYVVLIVPRSLYHDEEEDGDGGSDGEHNNGAMDDEAQYYHDNEGIVGEGDYELLMCDGRNDYDGEGDESKEVVLIEGCTNNDSINVKRHILAMETLEEPASSLPHDAIHRSEGDELSFSQRIYLLTTDRDVFMLLLLMVVQGMATAVIASFLFVYLQQLGGSDLLLGVCMIFTVLFELPFFFFGQQLIASVGMRGLLLSGMLSYIVRVSVYSFLRRGSFVWLVLLVEPLHGITFSCFWQVGPEIDRSTCVSMYAINFV